MVLLAVAVGIAACATGLLVMMRPSVRRVGLAFVVILVVVIGVMAALIALFLWANWSSIAG